MHRSSPLREPAMPAANPRITITLQPSVHALLKRLSALTGSSQSSMVGELLEQSAPVFERMVRVMEAAVEARDMAKHEVAGGLERAQAKLEKQLGLALETLDEGFRPLLEQTEAIKRRGAGAGGARLPRTAAPAPKKRTQAPISNRGVTPLPRKTRKAKKGGGNGPL